jgi:membrane-bound lytic murein transglycosylase D
MRSPRTYSRWYAARSWILGAVLLVGVIGGHSRAYGSAVLPHFSSASNDGFGYGLPPQIEQRGLVFAGTKVPLARADVRRRLLKEINYLLLNKRSLVLLWLARADALRPVVTPVLQNYQLPAEFIYLAAIESNYDARALSSAGAFGYWQFIKPTALQGPAGCDQYDWKMNITRWKDDRADLLHSTHSAARYLAWMNRVKKFSLNGKGDREGFNDWTLAAAAYNAGPKRVIDRLNAFGASSYWDVPLPVETERYVPRLIALAIIAAHRDFYGVSIPQPAALAFDTVRNVRLKKDLSFTAMARLLETTPRAIWKLNAHIPCDKGVFPARSGRTIIEHTIHVPKGTTKKFLAQLATHGYSGK